MDFDSLGITFHKQFFEFEKNWILAHGDEGNMNPNAGQTALNLAKKAGKSVVCGHTHRLGMSAYSEGLYGAYRPLYGIETGNLMNRAKASYPDWLLPTPIEFDPDNPNFTPYEDDED